MNKIFGKLIERRLTPLQMKEYGHKKLLDSHENIFTYLNEDGTRTVYIFSAPLEREKLCVMQGENEYRSKGDYTEIILPYDFNQEHGIRIGENIEFLPIGNKNYKAELRENINVFGQRKECVVYKDFGEENVVLNCYMTSFGVNSEIVIPQYTGTNIFTFEVRQPKEWFALTDSPDFIVFRDDADLKSMMYTSLVVDANNNWGYQNQIKLFWREAGVCEVSFVIDEEFLKNPNTKYPITINQSINMYKHKQPDTSVYSNVPETARHYLSPYMLLGKDTVKGEGWALIRFELLDNVNIKADEIISAEYNFANLFNSDRDVMVDAYAITNDWCSVNVKWESKPKYNDLKVNSIKVKEKGSYKIDITKLLKDIIKNKGEYEPIYSVRNSFLIKSDTRNSNLLLSAGDSGIFSPYLKIMLKREE